MSEGIVHSDTLSKLNIKRETKILREFSHPHHDYLSLSSAIQKIKNVERIKR